MTTGWMQLLVRLDIVCEQRDRSRHSLRLWRGIYWTLGIATVAAAALAGAGALADLFGAKVAGLLALGAAVLAATEKQVAAGDKVAGLQRRYNELNDLSCQLEAAVADARFRGDGSRPSGTGEGDDARWLTASADRADKALHAINAHSGEL